MSRFASAVQEKGGRSRVAKKLKCSAEFVRLMEVGERIPGLAIAIRIEKHLGVEVSYWQGRTANRKPESRKAAS